MKVTNILLHVQTFLIIFNLNFPMFLSPCRYNLHFCVVRNAEHIQPNTSTKSLLSMNNLIGMLDFDMVKSFHSIILRGILLCISQLCWKLSCSYSFLQTAFLLVHQQQFFDIPRLIHMTALHAASCPRYFSLSWPGVIFEWSTSELRNLRDKCMSRIIQFYCQSNLTGTKQAFLCLWYF